ncbi:MAG: ParA family protein [Oscillospiraceae bacterium]|nr:ParA family protein [Oscillospiraceae bacterium]
MARIISVITQKGGVGKTTTVNALAATLNKLGRRVLAIDMDPQGNLSFSLGAETEDVRTIYDVIRKEMNALDCIQRCNTSDVIPSDILLSSIELDYTGKNREFLLREALGDVKNLYDYILIDSPPSLGVLTVNALAASKYVFMPMLPDIFSLQGIAKVYDVIEHVRLTCNPKLEIGGVLVNRYNKRSKLHKEVMGTAQLVSRKLSIPVFRTAIRNSPAISEAQSLQCDITEYNRRVAAIRDFKALTEELIERGIL